MKLRTFEGEPITGELTTEYPMTRNGIPVLLVNGEPFSPKEAEFFLETATQEELGLLKEGGYDLPKWEGWRIREYGVPCRVMGSKEMRFGIAEKHDHTLEEVGLDSDLTRERIRQIEAKALRKMKHFSRANRLRSFIEN